MDNKMTISEWDEDAEDFEEVFPEDDEEAEGVDAPKGK